MLAPAELEPAYVRMSFEEHSRDSSIQDEGTRVIATALAGHLQFRDGGHVFEPNTRLWEGILLQICLHATAVPKFQL